MFFINYQQFEHLLYEPILKNFYICLEFSNFILTLNIIITFRIFRHLISFIKKSKSMNRL